MSIKTKKVDNIRVGDFFGKTIGISTNVSFGAQSLTYGQFNCLYNNQERICYIVSPIQLAFPVIIIRELDETTIVGNPIILNHTQQDGENTLYGNTLPYELVATGSFSPTSSYTANSFKMTLYDMGETKRLPYLLRRIIAKIESYATYTTILGQRFTRIVDVTGQISYKSGFSKYGSYTQEVGVMGGCVKYIFNTQKSSNWDTGNITNTAIATMKIDNTKFDNDYDYINFIYPTYTIAGQSGGIKHQAVQPTTTNNVEDQLTRTMYVYSVDTADKYAHFICPGVVRYNSIL